MLEKYIHRLGHLNTDRNRNRYPVYTNHRAPHKPFLLLSIMDLIAHGQIAKNIIEPSFELVETWNAYWNAIMPVGHKSTMAHPFPRLKTDKFWYLKTNAGYDPRHDYNVTSMAKCREIYNYASFDEELFQYMCDQRAREQLRGVLVQTYFTLYTQPKILDQGFVNIASYEYAEGLFGRVEEKVHLFEKESEEKKKLIRDAGFRKAIVTLYDHRCAMCGIRMLTPEGHTVAEAAHVIPWRESHDDRPTNGMCLCRLCHWSFDEGLMGVDKNYKVLVSGKVREDRNYPGHIFSLTERTIIKPTGEKFYPAQSNLEWHRKKVFQR